MRFTLDLKSPMHCRLDPEPQPHRMPPELPVALCQSINRLKFEVFCVLSSHQLTGKLAQR